MNIFSFLLIEKKIITVILINDWFLPVSVHMHFDILFPFAFEHELLKMVC